MGALKGRTASSRFLALATLVALGAAIALLLIGSVPAAAQQAVNDYDTDDDHLIEVDSLVKLSVIIFDVNGDGAADASFAQSVYDGGFPDPASAMGCGVGDHDGDASTADQAFCMGYELTADLDFDENGDGRITAAGDPTYWNGGEGWYAIGDLTGPYTAVFEGNGHTIDHLFSHQPTGERVGLFGVAGTGSELRNVGLRHADVTGERAGILAGNAMGKVMNAWSSGSVASTARATADSLHGVGGLVGLLDDDGSITHSYSTASVNNVYGEFTGGLVGYAYGDIRASYATGDVIARDGYVGGLLGYLNRTGSVTASYALGDAYGYKRTTRAGGLIGYADEPSAARADAYIVASYATGAVVARTSRRGGGLVGDVAGAGVTSPDSYWDTDNSHRSGSAAGMGKTAAELQGPTGYTGIYANWNVDLDNADSDDNVATGGDDPWDFGTGSQYPALKADWDGDGTATVAEFGSQRGASPAGTNDYDVDDDGLIEVDSLAKLDAVRHDLDGNGASGFPAHRAAFPQPMGATDMGCPDDDGSGATSDCLG
jgi:hypothetical protein